MTNMQEAASSQDKYMQKIPEGTRLFIITHEGICADHVPGHVSAIEDKVIFLYSQGVSTRGIQKTMQAMHGIDVDDSRGSKITDKLLPLIREWQERPL